MPARTGFEFHRLPAHADEEIIGPFKVLLVGDPAVGKTSIMGRYVDENFNMTYASTIGIDFRRKTLEVGHRKYVKLQIWDTAGQERFHGLVKSYFRGCDAVVFVYDVTDRQSFANLSNWIKTVLDVCQKPGKDLSDSLHCMLVGNKTDLSHGRKVTREEGRKMAAALNIDHFETSAKQNEQVTEMFSALSEALWVDWETKWGRGSSCNQPEASSNSLRLPVSSEPPLPAELSHLRTNMNFMDTAWEAKETDNSCCLN